MNRDKHSACRVVHRITFVNKSFKFSQQGKLDVVIYWYFEKLWGYA